MRTNSPSLAARTAKIRAHLRRALHGDDIGIVVDGKIVVLRPVAVEATDDAMREYGATAAELESFEKRVHGQIRKAAKAGDPQLLPRACPRSPR